MEEIREDTVGPQEKRAAVAVGRFSTPTVGHYKVIDAMKAFIRSNPKLRLESTPIVVIVDGEKTGQDRQRNPLTPEERISFMKASGRANGVVFLTAASGFDAWEEVRRAGYEPVAIAAGSDRAGDYKKMLDKHFTGQSGGRVDHVVVPGLERAADPVGESESVMGRALAELERGGALDDTEASGTMARAAVEHGYEDAFAKIVGLEKKPRLAKLMFDRIKKAMGDGDGPAS